MSKAEAGVASIGSEGIEHEMGGPIVLFELKKK
jgi:hypothetical protein